MFNKIFNSSFSKNVFNKISFFKSSFFKISFLIFVFSFFINTNITKANTYFIIKLVQIDNAHVRDESYYSNTEPNVYEVGFYYILPEYVLSTSTEATTNNNFNCNNTNFRVVNKNSFGYASFSSSLNTFTNYRGIINDVKIYNQNNLSNPI